MDVICPPLEAHRGGSGRRFWECYSPDGLQGGCRSWGAGGRAGGFLSVIFLEALQMLQRGTRCDGLMRVSRFGWLLASLGISRHALRFVGGSL